MSLATVSLDDKYALESGRIFVTGTQALVRLPMLQRQRDRAAGLNTAGFISGYRGSPLGGYDQALWRAKAFLKSNDIHFEPGVNEDLAATAVWGSQQLGLVEGARYDGVFGLWYGKGPGVDRTIDVFRHANFAGTSPRGGVLALAGDDHGAVSSTTAHQSEYNFQSVGMPVLHPASVQEYFDFGLLGFALSRFAGLWVGFKCVTETTESSASVSLDPDALRIVTPTDVEFPPDGVHLRWPDTMLGQERRLFEVQLPAALAFARANRLDREVLASPRRRLGVITTGKSYLDVRQALADLGVSEATARDIGLSIYKVGMVWPLEPQGLVAFARGHEELLVVEEKRPLIEAQVRDLLYGLPDGQRPRVVGKRDVDGSPLLPADGELRPARVAEALAQRLQRFHASAEIAERLAYLRAKARALEESVPALERRPYFCSGCPHNTSTKVPEGSRALAGIGCHYLALGMNRSTATFSQMGGEGVAWVGQAPFTREEHVFANIGDGTYQHSGLLAIRAAVAAGVNITYKLLYNDAVAMTGGQPVEGSISVADITLQLAGEGVKRIVVVSDDPAKYAGAAPFAAGVTLRHRDELDAVQRELREVKGCTVLVYEQTCAAEKRRRRSRGKYPDPDRRVFINHEVCEGCGDCSVQSNCVSIEPLETELGRKRVINQSSCNKDFSCLKGFCPSFVTVEGGRIRKARPAGAQPHLADGGHAAGLPEPAAAPPDRPYGILVTGIGGTGVVTIGAILAMAAHLEGRGVTVLDQTGLAQKNGAVTSHIRIAPSDDLLHSVRIGTGAADLVLACDMVTAASRAALDTMREGATRAVVNGHFAPTSDFTLNPAISFRRGGLLAAIREACGEALTDVVDGTGLATALMGDAIATNMFMLGYAYQRGLVPLSASALLRAIEVNGAAVKANKQAFAWGRLQAHDPAAVAAATGPAARQQPIRPPTLEALVEDRVRRLEAWGDARWAARYRVLVARAERAETETGRGRRGFAEAVARNAAKLMTYKDEYEVARLYADPAYARRLRDQFEDGFKLRFHLAPPLIARRDKATGELRKASFGGWMLPAFRLLARMKRLRGTPLDPFGYTEERRGERRLVEGYFALVERLCAGLSPQTYGVAVQLAELPDAIRGFGHVKARSLEAARTRERALLAELTSPPTAVLAAE